MKPSEILETRRDDIERVLQDYPMFSNIRIFGSVARGDDGGNSDLDLCVDAKCGTSLLDLAGLTADLSDLLGINVDVVTSGTDFHPIMKRSMERDMRRCEKYKKISLNFLTPFRLAYIFFLSAATERPNPGNARSPGRFEPRRSGVLFMAPVAPFAGAWIETRPGVLSASTGRRERPSKEGRFWLSVPDGCKNGKAHR